MTRGSQIALTCFLTLLMAWGCGPRRPPERKEARPPKQPPPVPAQKKEALIQPLREAARKEIVAAFASSDPRLRANALEAAQDTLGTQAETHRMIEQGLADMEAVVRFAAAMAAGRLQLADLHDPLWVLSRDADPRVQIGALFALHRIGDTRRSHDLEKTARDPDPRIRENTAFVLGLLGEKSALKILRQMTSDTDAGVRIQVAESMWRLGDEAGLEVLVAGTVSQFADDRMLCLLALAAPRDRRVSENLRGKLTDDYTEVALVAARAMGDIGFDDGYGVAMNSVRSTDPRQRLLAAMALGAIGRSDAQTTLATMLKDTDPRVRLGCATALLKLQEPG